MKTVVSRTGVEVLYTCSIHLLVNGEILECEYKSDNTGKDLIDYVCEQLHIEEKEFWGLKFVDTFEQRHWLELRKLIRPQVKNVCPLHFQFRVKVYPPEPYKLCDEETRYQIFMQLRLDLVSGRLGCGPSDSSLFIALILQFTYGDYNPNAHYGNYIREKIILNQSFAGEMKAIDLHQNHLKGLSKTQIIDLFLRMACQLETYGIDPYLVENSNQEKLNLWINHKGMVTYVEGKKVHHLEWMAINKIHQEDNKLIVTLVSGEDESFACLTKPECTYIYRSAIAHLTYFTMSGAQSTVGIIGNESMEELHEDLKSFENIERNEDVEIIESKHSLKELECKTSLISKVYSSYYHFWFTAILIFVFGFAYELYTLLDDDVLQNLIMNRYFSISIKEYLPNKRGRIF